MSPAAHGARRVVKLKTTFAAILGSVDEPVFSSTKVAVGNRWFFHKYKYYKKV